MTKSNEIADKVKFLCKEQGKSISWLSESSGIADKTLRRRLSAPEKFSLAELSSIARVLDTELEELVA